MIATDVLRIIEKKIRRIILRKQTENQTCERHMIGQGEIRQFKNLIP